jgi:phosphoserine aminotransferase
MTNRLHNFSAGPGVLPLSVLEEVKADLPIFSDAGASVMEISHRSAQYTRVTESAVERFRRLLGLTDDWHVLFLQGGASMQFYQVPLNVLPEGGSAAYVNTGVWATKAIEQATSLGTVHVVASSKDTSFDRIPDSASWESTSGHAYTHITTNNTIYGTQFQDDPTAESPVVADASSDFVSRPMNLSGYSLIYAGAQKNLGPAGVTVAFVRDAFLKARNQGVPKILDYATHAATLYNTPPVFAVYVVEKVLAWIESEGGLSAMAVRNREKAGLIYDRIDASNFYRGTSQRESRSLMNITFRLNTEELESRFIAEAKSQGLVSLKGHRSAGGIRASVYNACPMDSARALAQFMGEFERKNG